MSTDKRKSLVAAACEAFRRDGFAATRIGDIAGLAQVGKGTVYGYFASKEALLLACCLSLCEGNRAAIHTALAKDPAFAGLIPESFDQDTAPEAGDHPDPLGALRTILITAITHLIEHSTHNCRLFLELFTLARHNPALRAEAQPAILRVLERWEALALMLLQAAQAKGQIRPHPDLPGVSRQLSAIIDGLMLQRSWREDLSPADLARRTTDTFLAGLRP